MKVAEIFAELGFQINTVQLNDVVGLLGKLNLTSVLASFGVKELYEGISNIMEVATGTALGMRNFNEQTGLSSQKMQQWASLAERFGVKGESVSNALSGIQKKLIGLKMGTDSSLLTPLYMLNQAGAGITGNEDPFTFIQKIGKAFQNLRPEIRSTIADMLGFNQDMIVLLNHIDELKNAPKISVLDQEQVQNLVQFNKASKELAQTWQNIRDSIAAGLAPILDGLVKFTTYMTNLAKSSSEFRDYLLAIGVALEAMIAVSTGPIGALVVLFTNLAALLGTIVHYWEQIKSSMPDLSLGNIKAQAENVVSGIGKSVGGAVTSTQTTLQNTFQIVSNDAQGVAKEVESVISKLLSDARYQQQLQNY